MPYVYKVDPDFDFGPQPGETFQQFVKRCAQPLLDLGIIQDAKEAPTACMAAWIDYVLDKAVEATIVIKRPDIDPTSIYNDYWYDDWCVSSVVSAIVPTVVATPMEMGTAGSVTDPDGDGDDDTTPAGDTDQDFFKIKKSKDDEQLVFGWANIAKDANGNYPLDWDGDFTEPADLEKAAYEFVLKYRATGEKHEGEIKGQLVESVMFTKEKQAALGIPEGVMPEGWWVGFHIPDKEVFAKIKSGEYEMFSVQGSGQRIPVQE